MSGTKEIEARLDRSLRNQIRAPQLDQHFDAAVWARIDAARANTPVSRAQISARAARASRWLLVSNALGLAATLSVALFFAIRAFGGIDPPSLGLGTSVPIPELSEETVNRTLAVLGQVLGIVAILFGLSFTSPGRRLRASLF